MCGIVGYVGGREATPVLLGCLKRLEYRGYDSAGVATIDGNGLEVRKAVGKIASLEAMIGADSPRGRIGIAHTRWATHGRPSETNAHPQVDCRDRIAIVHNGIIENHRELRESLIHEGHRFRSQTDTEVIAHLLERDGSFGMTEAIMRAARELRGAYAVACIMDDIPNTLVAFRRGSPPLVIGFKDGEVLLGSDIMALISETREILVLEEGEIAFLAPGAVDIRTLDGRAVAREPTLIPWDGEAAKKGSYPHFMLKEIFEQPEAVRSTMRERVDPEAGEVRIPEIGLTDEFLLGLRRICIVACGTSYHAALVGKYLIETLARLPVEVDIASEFRYRQPVLDRNVLTVAISQSGETADTLGALREAKEWGSKVLVICNVPGSSAAREAEGVFYTRAGIEIGVASTKSFTAQLVAVTLLALKLAAARGMATAGVMRESLKELWAIPEHLLILLRRSDEILHIASRFADSSNFLFLGRGVNYPLALEGALKLKEISYIHAEGYPAGEMKHGPIALISPGMPVVAIAPRGRLYEKIIANIEEVKARDGIVIALASQGDAEIASKADHVFHVPRASEFLQPLVMAVPLQLLAYHIAVLRGCDVDQPRNLAKSVTVE